jgi:GNAT superfamily N-acetyltransferase
MARPRGFYDQQPEFLENTVLEITVPSGRLIASDDLRAVKHFDVVEIEIQDALNPEYEQPAHPGPYAVIHFFEVSQDHRRRGHGTEAAQLIADRYEDTALVAFSQDADEFWGSLGWARYEHTTDSSYRAMFVSTHH